jgi:hypothetical protein
MNQKQQRLLVTSHAAKAAPAPQAAGRGMTEGFIEAPAESVDFVRRIARHTERECCAARHPAPRASFRGVQRQIGVTYDWKVSGPVASAFARLISR